MSISSIYNSKQNTILDDGSIQTAIILNKSNELYLGHFPNKPITPGVVLLQILKDLVEEQLQTKLLMQETSKVKFLAIVNPNVNTELIYNIEIKKKDNTFRIKNTTTFPDGTLVFKCLARFKYLS